MGWLCIAWVVYILQNGQNRDPNLFGPPTFLEYDLAAVRVSSILPIGAPVSTTTTVTLLLHQDH